MSYLELLKSWLAAHHPGFTPEFEGDAIINWQAGMGACPSPSQYESLLAWYNQAIAPQYMQFGSTLRAEADWRGLCQSNPDAIRMEDFLARLSDGLIELDAVRVGQFRIFWQSLKPEISPALLAKIRQQATANRLPEQLVAIVNEE